MNSFLSQAQSHFVEHVFVSVGFVIMIVGALITGRKLMVTQKWNAADMHSVGNRFLTELFILWGLFGLTSIGWGFSVPFAFWVGFVNALLIAGWLSSLRRQRQEKTPFSETSR